MFEWDVQSVRRVIAKMIAGKDLSATLDAPKQTLVINQQKPSYLQKMALHYADKVCATDSCECIILLLEQIDRTALCFVSTRIQA